MEEASGMETDMGGEWVYTLYRRIQFWKMKLNFFPFFLLYLLQAVATATVFIS